MKTFAKIQSVRGLWLAKQLHLIPAAFALALLVFAIPANADPDGRAPELPSPLCDSVQPPDGQRVSFRAYAIGVQIYIWNGTAWAFQGPEAGLYADPGYHGQIGIHYGGPTWEANDGSKVQAAVFDRCQPEPGTIPWLLLQTTAAQGPGLFDRVTWIQRLNTIGGTAPANPGAFIGEEARVPYTAEYYFYRATTN